MTPSQVWLLDMYRTSPSMEASIVRCPLLRQQVVDPTARAQGRVGLVNRLGK